MQFSISLSLSLSHFTLYVHGIVLKYYFSNIQQNVYFQVLSDFIENLFVNPKNDKSTPVHFSNFGLALQRTFSVNNIDTISHISHVLLPLHKQLTLPWNNHIISFICLNVFLHALQCGYIFGEKRKSWVVLLRVKMSK